MDGKNPPRSLSPVCLIPFARAILVDQDQV